MDLKGALGPKPLTQREQILHFSAPLGNKATAALGIKEMGAGGMVGWDGQDVALFREGLRLLGRDFPGIAKALKVRVWEEAAAETCLPELLIPPPLPSLACRIPYPLCSAILKLRFAPAAAAAAVA